MTSAKRKSQQDSIELEGQKLMERKVKREEMMPSSEPQSAESPSQPPALTINIHSWATPIVGIVMLVIGALAGFYARPSVLGQLPESTTRAGPVVAIPTEDRSEAQQQLMASLLPKVRHFLGDSNAPVTIIEFGDFQ